MISCALCLVARPRRTLAFLNIHFNVTLEMACVSKYLYRAMNGWRVRRLTS